MENNGTNTNMGDLVISEEVIATIVTNATMDVKGVAAMAPKAAADIRGLFHKRKARPNLLPYRGTTAPTLR